MYISIARIRERVLPLSCICKYNSPYMELAVQIICILSQCKYYDANDFSILRRYSSHIALLKIEQKKNDDKLSPRKYRDSTLRLRPCRM